jgi:hypothetical protein
MSRYPPGRPAAHASPRVSGSRKAFQKFRNPLAKKNKKSPNFRRVQGGTRVITA